MHALIRRVGLASTVSAIFMIGCASESASPSAAPHFEGRYAFASRAPYTSLWFAADGSYEGTLSARASKTDTQGEVEKGRYAFEGNMLRLTSDAGARRDFDVQLNPDVQVDARTTRPRGLTPTEESSNPSPDPNADHTADVSADPLPCRLFGSAPAPVGTASRRVRPADLRPAGDEGGDPLFSGDTVALLDRACGVLGIITSANLTANDDNGGTPPEPSTATLVGSQRPSTLVAQNYCETVTGTRFGWCTDTYRQLHPTAQRIIDAHERVHQGQNPFAEGSHACREAPAYIVQGNEASAWLHPNGGSCRPFPRDAAARKEWSDVQLLCYEAGENGSEFCKECRIMGKNPSTNNYECRNFPSFNCCS